MSQSNNPKDSQALLQSMLQRLKLQPGREGQEFLHTPAPVTVASTWGQDVESAAPNFQKVNTSPVNGFQFAVDSNSVPVGREIQQPSQGEVDRGISFPFQKDNVDDDTGEKRVFGQVALPEITPTGRGQLFPAKSLKDSDITSFERTDGERVSCSSPVSQDAVTSTGQNQDQNQGFTPKVHMGSLKPTDASLQVGSGENKMGNGDSTQSKDAQFVTSSPNNSSSRRKQRSSENKTRRWTQKLKERWRDKQGKPGKKEKDERGTVDQKSEQAKKVSPQHQLPTSENIINTSHNEDERTLPSLGSIDPGKIPPAHTEDSSHEGRNRSYSDFEFSLGSFSLLEEIVMGQEWARFLNPNLPATSVDQRPSEEPLSQFQTPSNPLLSNQQRDGNNQWSLWSTKTPSGSNFGMTQLSPEASLPVRMEVLEGKQQESVHRQAYRSEPMDDGPLQPAERGLGVQHRPPSFVQLQHAEILDKSRAHPNRKRHHQSDERGAERLQTEKMSDREVLISSPSTTSSNEMDKTGGPQNDNIMPLYTLNSLTLASPSSLNPFAPAPRSVLKHSISQDSESSMGTMTKRRRVEENRRVRFAEQVVAIEPLELDFDAMESEEDSGAEEDSVIEQECVVEQTPVEEVAPARRHALPAWILALKRKNHGRKK